MVSSELFMEYVDRFGAAELPPLYQMPPEQCTDEFLDKLYRRCLKEGKPASEYITVAEDPDVLY